LGGGLIVHQPVLQQKVRDALAVTGILDVRPLTREPVHGAVRLALDTTRRKPAVT
jgi:hypothetical protein